MKVLIHSFVFLLTIATTPVFAQKGEIGMQTPLCELAGAGVPNGCVIVSAKYGNNVQQLGTGPSDTICPKISIPAGHENCNRLLKCFKAGIDHCYRESKINKLPTSISSNQSVICQNGNLAVDSNGQKDSCVKFTNVINQPGLPKR